MFIAVLAGTMAGNLTLIGSASNIIVATNSKEEATKVADKALRGLDHLQDDDERAKREALADMMCKPVGGGGLVDFNAKRHAKFGVPLTLITCSVGVTILYVELKVLKWSI